MRISTIIATLCLFTCSVNSQASAEHWYQFLGPTGESRSAAQKLPVKWSETENVKWKVPIHGRGWSSPVELEGRIWMGTATPDGHEMFAVCVDAKTGKTIHDIKLFEIEEPREIHKLNSYASPTPILEPGRAYMHFGSYGTACLDAKTGKKIWERTDLPCHHWRGPGSSPIIHGEKLILHYDGFDFQYIIAMNKNTGETIWKKDRAPYIDFMTDNGDQMKAYCTPIVVEVDGKMQVVSPAARATVGYDLETGEELWKVTFKEHSATAKPIYRDGMFYINTGFSKAKLMAVKEGGKGDVTETHVSWVQAKSVPSKPTPILVDGLIFMIHDQGVATCIDAESGDIVWQERVSGNYSSSPLFANGQIYVFSQEGKATIFKAAREFEIVAENDLDAGFMASPGVVDNDLILRTETHLYRLGK